MTAFEFVFGLFGLLVGLSLTEMLAGLARTLKSARHIRIGWLVPALGFLVLINLTIFWYGAWQFRGVDTLSSGTLLLTMLIGGTYFLAASMIFPNAGEEGVDLDRHFFSVRRPTIAAIGLCNVLGLGIIADLAEWEMSPVWWIGNGLFLVLLIVAAAVRSERLALAAMVTMIVLHGVGVALGR